MRSKPAKEYSKSSKDYARSKSAFFNNNGALLSEALLRNEKYCAGPLRSCCRVCHLEFANDPDFQKHGVPYQLCRRCDHLNGVHYETDEFFNSLYIDDGGTEYAQNYIDGSFEARAELVYAPKVQFLLKHCTIVEPKVLDVGCGAGHFVYSCRQLGIEAQGIDVGSASVTFGNRVMSNGAESNGEDPLIAVKHERDLYQQIATTKADIVSAIGVIEHLRDLDDFVDSVQTGAFEFLYISVPLASFSIFIESCFPSIFPRQLSAGHTHLFSERSIQTMTDRMGFHSTAEWRFGTDTMDVMRSMMITLKNSGFSDHALQTFEIPFNEIADELQQIFDKHHFCSEIHVLLRRN